MTTIKTKCTEIIYSQSMIDENRLNRLDNIQFFDCTFFNVNIADFDYKDIHFINCKFINCKFTDEQQYFIIQKFNSIKFN